MPCHHFSRGDLLAFYLGWWTGQFPESVSPVHGNFVGIGVEEGNVLGMGSSKSVLLFIIWSVEGPGVHEHAVHLMWRCAWRGIVVWYLVGGTQR